MSIKKGIHITLWVGNFLLTLLYLVTIPEPPALLQFFGRLHPMVLHFPLVLLLITFLFEVYAQKKPNWKEPAEFLLAAGAATAYISALAGFLLSANGSYAGQTFDLHQWLGLATSWLATVLFTTKPVLVRKKAYLPLFALASLLLIITGHLGANLTHGEGFLTEVFEEVETGMPAPETAIFEAAIQPILKQKCVSCHNTNKQKGGLLLTSADMLKKGGENGQVFIAGDVVDSKLISYLHLNVNDKLHMPPKGKLQLTNDEKEILSWWVEAGASFEETLGALQADAPIQATLTNYFEPATVDIPFAEKSTMDRLQAAGISINPLSEDSPYLEAFLGNRKASALEDLKQLRKVSDQLYSLDLGSSPIDNKVMKELRRFKSLHRLYLDNTELDDDQLSYLKSLRQLEYLNLYGTAVTERGVSRLVSKLPELKKLFLWQTQISEPEMASLKEKHAQINIDGGLNSESFFATAQLVPPNISFESVFFDETMTIEADYQLANAKVYYQLDDKPYQVLDGSQLILDRSAQVSFVARKEGWEDSEIRSETFVKINQPTQAKKTLKHDPKGSYTAKGVSTIFDLRKGSENFRDGEWLGFNGDDMVVDVTLSAEQELSSVYISTMDDVGSWIFPPLKMEVWAGNDPNQLKKVSELSMEAPTGPIPKNMAIHQLRFEKQSVKHLQIRAVNYGNLPEWHPGKGTPAWLFIDEVAFQ